MFPASCFTLPKWLKQYGGRGGGDAPRGCGPERRRRKEQQAEPFNLQKDAGEAVAVAKEAQRRSEGASEGVRECESRQLSWRSGGLIHRKVSTPPSLEAAAEA